jgi:DNA-directed RNA polymerase beta' subunit
MKQEDNIKSLFNRLQNELNVSHLPEGHTMRFLEKLDASKQQNKEKTYFNKLKPIIGIAAAIVLGFALFALVLNPEKEMDLAQVSVEMASTQNFFYQTINTELKKIDLERTPETESIIKDALSEMNKLELEYETLKTDLKQSNNDKRVIYAMISNFQNRIELLQAVLEQIETIKEFKHQSNENNIL